MENSVEVIERGKITVNIYEGQKGETGASLRFEDLTTEQKLELKGEKGDKGEQGEAGVIPRLTDVYQQLKYKGYVAKSDEVGDIVTLLVNQINLNDLVSTSSFTYITPKYGNTSVVINCTGVDGMELVERGTQNKQVLNSYTATHSTVFTLSKPMSEKNVIIDVVWDGQIRKTLTIKGVNKLSIPTLIGNINYQRDIDDAYVYAVYDNQKTVYFKSPKQTGKLDDIIQLVNKAANIKIIPTDVTTLVLELGGPSTLDYTAEYPTITSDMMFTASNSTVTIPSGDVVIDLRKLNVTCDNVIFILNSEMYKGGGRSVDNFYVITDKGHTISVAARYGNNVSEPETKETQGLTVASVSRNSVDIKVTNATEDHL